MRIYPPKHRMRACHPVVAGLVSILGALSCRSATPLLPSAPAPSPTRAVYDGVVSLRPDSGTIVASWSLRLARRPGADSVVLLLNSSVTVAALTGRDVARYDTQNDRGLAKLTVHLSPRSGAAETERRLQYAGALHFGEDGINGLSPAWVELGLDSFWFPVVADLAHDARGRVRVVLPAGYRVISSGSQTQRGDTVEIVNTRALPDFAFVASRALKTTAQGQARTFDAGAAPEQIARMLATAAQCAGYLNTRYGARDPMVTADLVMAPRTGPGYARQRYVVISVGPSAQRNAPADSVGLTKFVCHEFAHYWSIGAVPSGPDNWLNEAFAEFVAARAVRTLLGESAWLRLLEQWQAGAAGQGPIWTPTQTARPHPNVAYRKAPALLAQLEARVGSALMDAMLTRFMTEPLRTTPAVLDMIEQTLGREHGGWFRTEVGR
ncbi:MAG: hypothetical protein LCH84_19390 [Gemmatimonadetes bacterium]|nr:hypothetical protein [Gemmatimonadota bacterium]